MENKCWVYSLHDPDTDELRYIGETTNTISKRLDEHMNNPTSCDTQIWIDKLKSQNKRPKVKVIEHCDCDRRHQIEKRHIKINASDRLLNIKHNPYRERNILNDKKPQSKPPLFHYLDDNIADDIINNKINENQVIDKTLSIKEFNDQQFEIFYKHKRISKHWRKRHKSK